MSIRRQYSLPNCTLILDGLGDSQRTNDAARPLMSTLVNAECHISGHKEHLSGGMEFFQQLITAVSNYTQELLSKVVNPPTAQQVGKIRLEKGQEHRLIAQSENGEVDWQLSTVQLFDLTEAIDQFLADGSTLPNLLVGIQPAPRAAKGVISAQAAPIGLGLSGLAATALAFYLVPAPGKITIPAATTTPISKPVEKPSKPAEPPTTKQSTPVSPAASASPSVSPKASSSPAVSPTSSPAASSKPSDRSAVDPKINDNPTQVAFIERKLRREISQEWKDRKGLADKLDYTIAANTEGKIISYEPKNSSAKSNQELIPFPKMVPSSSPEKSATEPEKVAEYNVSFTPNGAIEIKRAKLLKGSPTLGQTIADADKVKGLATNLNDKVKLATTPTFKKDLNYRVAADESGEIVDYEPIDQAAFDYEKETPLPAVTKYDAAAAAGNKPLAQYTVTYRPDGKVVVNPRQ
jgi:Domain of unknown function (DUF4335)